MHRRRSRRRDSRSFVIKSLITSLGMPKNTPLRDKKNVGKKIGKLLKKKPTKEKKPVGDKAMFDLLTTRAARSGLKSDGKTSA